MTGLESQCLGPGITGPETATEVTKNYINGMKETKTCYQIHGHNVTGPETALGMGMCYF